MGIRNVSCSVLVFAATSIACGTSSQTPPVIDAMSDSGPVEIDASTDVGSPPGEPIAAPDEPGPFVVGHTQRVEIDTDRADRTLTVDIWYPVDSAVFEAAADPTPTGYLLAGVFTLPSELAFEDLPVAGGEPLTLLVFSHGYGGINTQSVRLMENLASHGFIVASPEHTGNAQGSDPPDSFDVAAGHRVPDVSFVIDRLSADNDDPESPFFGRVDTERVGVVGHSFGGMTALGSACGWAGAAPDLRVAAIAPISAVIRSDLQSASRQGSNAGFTDEQLATITIPTLLVGGTADEAVPVENNAIALAAMKGAPVVYSVSIDGANHTHFANVCDIGNLLIEAGINPDMWESLGAGALIEPYAETCTPEAFPIETATRLQNLYVTAFFLKHLSGQAAYDAFLTEDYAASEEAVVLQRVEP